MDDRALGTVPFRDLRATRANRTWIHSALAASALTLTLVLLWTLTHQYGGLTRDAHIYAFQAMAKIHPALQSDIYLSNTSQDRFTIFSPIYAACIQAFGLTEAETLLLGLCAAAFLVAAWFLARAVTDGDLAWLAVGLLILTVGHYGAFDIFHFSEDYLTARSLAEALVVTALACHFLGWRKTGLLIGAVAMLVHPLMAFPGILMLLASWANLRWNIIGAAAGIGAALLISAGASALHIASGPLAVLDAAWLNVVRERSQFLFLQLWHLHDWDQSAKPLLTVALAALVFHDDPRMRKLCIGAWLVGASGLIVALIAGLIGPVAILLQGQAWRWVWITGLFAVILLPATMLRMWSDRRCGAFAAILTLLAWTFQSIDGSVAIAAAIGLWSIRGQIGPSLGVYMRWSAGALAALVVLWIIGNSWTYALWKFDFRNAPLLLQHTRNILGLTIPAMLLLVAIWTVVLRGQWQWLTLLLSTGLAACAVITLPLAFQTEHAVGLKYPHDDFSDWRKRIAPTANVYVDDGGDSPVFAWFALQRPSYLSVDQSAGVVFSRATALEIRRRAANLLPMIPPDWQILTKRAEARSGKVVKKGPWPRPLTAQILRSVCSDLQLGFLVAHQDVGFGALRHSHSGPWNGWYLYDCRQVRSETPTT